MIVLPNLVLLMDINLESYIVGNLTFFEVPQLSRLKWVFQIKRQPDGIIIVSPWLSLSLTILKKRDDVYVDVSRSVLRYLSKRHVDLSGEQQLSSKQINRSI